MNMDKWNNTSTEAFLAVRLGISTLFLLFSLVILTNLVI